jgi:hypothetical protein
MEESMFHRIFGSELFKLLLDLEETNLQIYKKMLL